MPLASVVVVWLTALPQRSVPVSVTVTPAMRGSLAAACGTPPLAPLRSRSSNTVPAIDERCTGSVLVPLSKPPGVLMPPVFVGSASTVAVLVTEPPAG